MAMIPNLRIFWFFVFYKSKNSPKRQQARLFPAIDIYGVCRMIGNKILTNFDISKFEIGPLEAEEEANYNIVQIIPDFFFYSNYRWLYYKTASGIDFGLWELPEIDDDYDDDDNVDDDDDVDDYNVFSSSQRISIIIGTRGKGQ